jgi:hypothetical protein
LGKPIPYKASADDFFQIIEDLKETHGYCHLLQELCSPEKRKTRTKRFLNQWIKAIEKPPMPHKLIPIPVGPNPKD